MTPTTVQLDDWLAVSTEGFAQRQLDRPPAHLVKELIQNALDATEGLKEGLVRIVIKPETVKRKTLCVIAVSDNGHGIDDPKDLRTLYSSGKEDSFHLRGRMGQGAKEILCLARYASVTSKRHHIDFTHEQGQRVTKIRELSKAYPGTLVTMGLPWDAKEIGAIEAYLHTLIPPAKRKIYVNSTLLAPRKATTSLQDLELKTEVFENGRWARRIRTGTIDLLQTRAGEAPMIFEMGIPVCSIDWPQPFHINVHMRIPMNPRRDAVATGYMKDVYRQILPHLMDTLSAEELRNEWVSEAIEDLPPETQKNVITRAFGDKAVRSTPTMGRHDFDSDAREIGYTPIQTRLLPKGLRTAAETHLQSSRDVEFERRAVVAAAVATDSPATARDERIKTWCRWLAQEVLGKPILVNIVQTLIINGHEAAAAWHDGGILALNTGSRDRWVNPFEPEAIGLLVHEMAHEIAMHHGDDFRRAVEKIAGRVATVFLEQSDNIKANFADLF